MRCILTLLMLKTNINANIVVHEAAIVLDRDAKLLIDQDNDLR